ncbi:KR domain-containing protein [Colletotrichum cereale]|nr:KR domain-containing protein [Colletotrichum cereale]
MTVEKSINIDIAICGMSLRVAGGLSTPEEFWTALAHGQDMQEPVPPQRYNIHGFTRKLGGKNGLESTTGYFVNTAELGSLDVSHFQMSKDELTKCDPQQRLMLETTYEALDDAGEMEYAGAPIGCYVGTSAEDWLRMSARELQHIQGNVLGGVTDFMLPNRVSYHFDLKGPSFAIKTGCSASLIALHLACTDLRNGSISGAVVGGTSLLLDPTMTSLMASDGIISPSGSCNTFDAKADGFARADGIAVLYIKRLDDALRDKNSIRAVIKGTGTNTDGRNASATAGLMQPNSETQEALMRKTYADAGLDPHETAFIELHGTGTPVGDPIECKAVGHVFGRGNPQGVYIGSVKPNVGHTEAASGLVSVIKAVLSLEHGFIPPNIKFTKPNPDIPFTELGLTVPTKLIQFPANRSKRVSVNSFGVGGANAHVILDAVSKPTGGKLLDSQGPQILLFSANTQSSLKENRKRLSEFMGQNLRYIPDIAYTLGLRRQKMPYRAFQIVDDRGQTTGEGDSTNKVPKENSKIVMVFTGQGAQWPEMGATLIERDSRFRADLDQMDRILQTLQRPPEWHVIDELKRSPDTSNIRKARLSQPLCTILQIALFHRFNNAGVKPKAVIGHSSGEIAAAYAAGKISLDAAVILAYYRGLVGESKASPPYPAGAMAAINLGSKQLSPILPRGVVVACENSPSSTTISGDEQAVEEMICRIKAKFPEVDCRPLKVDLAYHSHHMEAPAQEYLRAIQDEMEERRWVAAKKNFPSADIAFISTLLGKTCDDASLQAPEYWAHNLVSPVRFASAVACLLENPQLEKPLFLEIGPHGALAGPLRQNCIVAGQQCDYITALTRGEDSRVSLLSAFGELFLRGVDLDWSTVFLTGTTIGGMPPYAWDHSNAYWYESRLSKDWRFRKFPHHCLLGSRLTESSDFEPIWRNMLHMENEPWLADHKVQEHVVYPLVCYATMAGEAVRQLTGIEDGYTIKDLVVRAALILPESAAVEILTSVRHHRISNVDLQSKWFSFKIASFNGSSWTIHCEGLIKAYSKAYRPNGIIQRSTTDSLPRKVNMSRFYEGLSRAGITYGPEFQLLKGVRSGTTRCEAQGEILLQQREPSEYFVQHPTMMDACFQLVFVSLARGLTRNTNRILMPTKIHDIDVRRCPVEAQTELVRVAASGTENYASVECIMGDSVLFYIGGAEFSQLEDDFISHDRARHFDHETIDPHAAARLHWLPDASCMDVGSLIRPPAQYSRSEVILLEELTLLCIIESAEQVKRLQPSLKFMERYRKWLLREAATAQRGDHPFIQNSAALASLLPGDRKAKMDEIYEALLKTERTSLPISVKRIHEEIEAVFEGKSQVLDVLMRDNQLTKLYGHLSFDYGDFIRIISHWRPTLRILEVGAGTGATTETIIRSLLERGPNTMGLPAYSNYTFTDISASFFFAAKQRFSYAPNMDYKVLDASQDVLSQGFEPKSFDVIFAANVLHATPSLSETLKNLWPVLKPGGMIIITELCCVKRCAGYIFGTLPGWWLGADDDREWEPYVPVSRWDTELRNAGFTGVETALYDDEQPFHFSATMVSRKLDISRKEAPKSHSLTILSEKPNVAPSRSLYDYMRQEGWDVAIRGLDQIDTLPEDTDIICCLDLEAEFMENLTEQSFHLFQRLIKRLTPQQKMLWLARPVQSGCSDPRSAMGVGVAKAVRAELGVDMITLEIDGSESRFSELVEQVMKRIRREEREMEEEKLQPDKEFAVINGIVCTGRYCAFSLSDELTETTNALAVVGSSSPWQSARNLTRKALRIDTPGRMETLRWVEEPICEVVNHKAVEVEPYYVGLNFRDVAIANGLLKLPEESLSGFGAECAGVVTRTGKGVEGLSVGDRVMAMAAGGCLSTRVVLPALQVTKVPRHMGLEEAASIPACFSTAWRALCDLGRLESGQTVLIHSACGGVGLAAVQVCRLMGAEIYATVSSPDKVDHLVHEWDIPRRRIFDSRSDAFYGGVMRETGGKGVDLVLNSLSGSLLYTSWKCVAPFGTLIELGKRDIAAAGKLDMEPFLQNRSYICVNMAQIIREKPESVGRIMDTLVPYFDQGILQPLTPRHLYTPLEMHKAFLNFQKGAHIGKLLVKLGREEMSFNAAPTYRPITFRSDAAYLLVGGLGGLGRSIATWMAERGARHLTFLSRSAGSTAESKELFEDLSSMGCHATAVAGLVDNADDVARAIKATEHPIRGVFQLAMVLKDSSISEMSWSDWCTAIQPKVYGTYNLHHELSGQPLDFFWMASSLVTVIEQVGQGNYGAANMFLEAFSQYRRSIGLPASVLNISPIEGIGYVAEHPHAKRSITFQDMGFESEAAFLDALELSLLHSRVSPAADEEESESVVAANPPRSWTNKAQIVMGLRSTRSLDDSSALTNWRFNRRMGFYHNRKFESTDAGAEAGGEDGVDQAVRTLLGRVSRNVAVIESDCELAFLAQTIGRKVLDMTLKSADTVLNAGTATLSELGVDSLMAVELRRWFRSAFAIHVSALEAIQAGTLLQLGHVVAGKLKEKHGRV